MDGKLNYFFLPVNLSTCPIFSGNVHLNRKSLKAEEKSLTRHFFYLHYKMSTGDTLKEE
jgi:hypothetical protein